MHITVFFSSACLYIDLKQHRNYDLMYTYISSRLSTYAKAWSQKTLHRLMAALAVAAIAANACVPALPSTAAAAAAATTLIKFTLKSTL